MSAIDLLIWLDKTEHELKTFLGYTAEDILQLREKAQHLGETTLYSHEVVLVAILEYARHHGSQGNPDKVNAAISSVKRDMTFSDYAYAVGQNNHHALLKTPAFLSGE